MPLQRVIADFGADHAFGQVPTKLQEHYSIQIPVSTIRKMTELHGQKMHDQRLASSLPTDEGCLQQIAEIDGCMLPVKYPCKINLTFTKKPLYDFSQYS